MKSARRGLPVIVPCYYYFIFVPVVVSFQVTAVRQSGMNDQSDYYDHDVKQQKVLTRTISNYSNLPVGGISFTQSLSINCFSNKHPLRHSPKSLSQSNEPSSVQQPRCWRYGRWSSNNNKPRMPLAQQRRKRSQLHSYEYRKVHALCHFCLRNKA